MNNRDDPDSSVTFFFLWALVLSGLLQLIACTTESSRYASKDLRLNEIQIIGSHNSYKKAIDPGLLLLISASDPELAQSLDYAHLTLSAQLSRGIRKLELDVYFDPDGGRYAKPMGLSAITTATAYDADGRMKKPGFKVFHIQDIDFRSHCFLLRDCLKEIQDWSKLNPAHIPLVISVNAKTDLIDRPGFVQPLQFDEQAWLALDHEFRQVLGEKLITPDELRGKYDSLAEAISKNGWPLLDESRGKFLVVLDDSREKLESYKRGYPALRGRVMFGNYPEGEPEAAIRIINDPIKQYEYIQSLVKQGYIVRTRADADTMEARAGATQRRDTAFASGAQIISTDYYQPDKRFISDYQVMLPGGAVAQCNPVLVVQSCVLVEN